MCECVCLCVCLRVFRHMRMFACDYVCVCVRLSVCGLCVMRVSPWLLRAVIASAGPHVLARRNRRVGSAHDACFTLVEHEHSRGAAGATRAAASCRGPKQAQSPRSWGRAQMSTRRARCAHACDQRETIA